MRRQPALGLGLVVLDDRVGLLGRLHGHSAPLWLVLGGVAVVAGIVLAQSSRRAPVLVEPPHPG